MIENDEGNEVTLEKPTDEDTPASLRKEDLTAIRQFCNTLPGYALKF
jgi:hypothetical protein